MSRWGMARKAFVKITCAALITTREETVGAEVDFKEGAAVAVEVDVTGAAVGDPA